MLNRLLNCFYEISLVDLYTMILCQLHKKSYLQVNPDSVFKVVFEICACSNEERKKSIIKGKAKC